MSRSLLLPTIPGPKSQELLALRQQFVAQSISSTMNVFAALFEIVR
jgi:hypothetical protein